MRRWVLPLSAVLLAGAVLWAVTSWPVLRTLGGQGPEGAAEAVLPDTASASADQRRAELAQFLERHPRDGRGWVLLAYAEMEADRFEAAAAAFEKAVNVAPKVAADPAVWCEYADALGMAQGGSLAGRPTELVMHALALRPGHPKALEMAGSAAYERREFKLAAEYWRSLLPQLAPGTQPHGELSQAIARAERLGALSLPAER
jgi:cytochrome c-type biogenesis protein CcmH